MAPARRRARLTVTSVALALCTVTCLAAAPGNLSANAPPSVTWGGPPTNISTGSGLPSMLQLMAGSGAHLFILADGFDGHDHIASSSDGGKTWNVRSAPQAFYAFGDSVLPLEDKPCWARTTGCVMGRERAQRTGSA